MIFILGWATVLVFILWALLAALPEHVKKIDEEILQKHRAKDQVRATKKAAKKGDHLKLVK